MPPGFMLSIYGNDDRFVKSYMSEFPGYYDTGDVGYKDEDGYVYVTSRSDDVIKVSGHRLSTGALEEVPQYLGSCLFLLTHCLYHRCSPSIQMSARLLL